MKIRNLRKHTCYFLKNNKKSVATKYLILQERKTAATSICAGPLEHKVERKAIASLVPDCD